MFNPEQLLGQILGGALSGSFSNKKKSRGSMFTTGNLAGKAQLGVGLLGVAIAAYEHYQQKNAATEGVPAASPPPPPPPPPPANDAAALQKNRDLTLLVQAAIAAAAADGHIDETERARILVKAKEIGLDGEALSFLEQELQSPKSAFAIGALSRSEIAADVYRVSLLAIDLDSEAERIYLATLAKCLNLSNDQQQALQRPVET